MSGLRAGFVWISPIAALVGDVLKAGRRSLISRVLLSGTGASFGTSPAPVKYRRTPEELSCGKRALRPSLPGDYGLSTPRAGPPPAPGPRTRVKARPFFMPVEV